MKPPPDLTPEQLRRWTDHVRLVLADAPEALEWYALWQRASNLMDDLVDLDVPINRDSPCELVRTMMLLMLHPFFQRHQQVLAGTALSLLAMYQVSLDADKEERMSSWLMAEASRMMPVLVVLLAKGYHEAVQMGRFMRTLMAEAYQDQPNGFTQITPDMRSAVPHDPGPNVRCPSQEDAP